MIKRPRQSFLTRLILASALLTAVTAGLVGVAASRIARNHLIDEAAAKLRSQGSLLVGRVPPKELRAGDRKGVDALADGLGAAVGERVTITGPDGTVLGDSEVSLPELEGVENHAARPEIRGAQASGFATAIRRSATLGTDFLYAAIPVVDGRNAIGTLRLATPLSGVEEKIRGLQKTIALWAAFCLLGALALSIYVSRSIHGPIGDLAAAAERIAGGDFAARAKSGTGDEIGRLGEVLNALSRRVSETISALSAEKMQLQATFDNMVEGVALVAVDGRVEDLNPVMERLFGVEAGTARGKRFVEIVRQAPLEDLLKRSLELRTPQQGEWTLFTPEERTFEAHANPIVGEAGLQGAVLVLHDITRLRRLEEVRKEFVANVSHELRTPLASIKGFAETLRRGGVDDPEHRMEFVETIERHADGLTRLVEDLLELASIESGKRGLRRERVALRAFADEIWQSIRPIAEKRGVSLVNEAAGELAVWFDKGALHQVLQNLLANAVKYNRRNGTVTLRAVREDGGARLRVSVEDTGIGVPRADLPRVFERFYRVDKARSRELGGTGLGLSIVKHLVESHGGKVGAESSEGKGSTFHFVVPAES
ncbi:MAG: hypothetical protein AUJ52_12805 [Elusimicrobia bacterium CG1_02_63_36]|nr:MAG: hypothetical protein AUJ52_12805 [Elusimicrobia bacterium CG1_02_63_36]PIP83923.1 MAG: PAS domain-containing sensor histidine kinase [Elusimicrobia bacterium CG22_combo_CG10-13_8_21_14_all_63_91]PJA14882.1 MAG: PAS domain-containing sensor histidine kinase [Elusimicrobia bacterium CG_4_10_14_0_2_um_filter_63_34]PJB26712.1 MAG: PAS domain-containing sensor histidine kinase [Elusimicrobia bacterium CG_4_9_14_3_um_filter_62_55]